MHLQTRRWERQQEAERLVDRAYHASENGAKDLMEQARKLYQPEAPIIGAGYRDRPEWLRLAVGS